jgi:hypothetical protein
VRKKGSLSVVGEGPAINLFRGNTYHAALDVPLGMTGAVAGLLEKQGFRDVQVWSSFPAETMSPELNVRHANAWASGVWDRDQDYKSLPKQVLKVVDVTAAGLLQPPPAKPPGRDVVPPNVNPPGKKGGLADLLPKSTVGKALVAWALYELLK